MGIKLIQNTDHLSEHGVANKYVYQTLQHCHVTSHNITTSIYGTFPYCLKGSYLVFNINVFEFYPIITMMS